MSQRVVEETLGRLICDARFRRRFRGSVEQVVADFELELTPAEFESLRRVEMGVVAGLAEALDERIRRTGASSGGRRQPRTLGWAGVQRRRGAGVRQRRARAW